MEDALIGTYSRTIQKKMLIEPNTNPDREAPLGKIRRREDVFNQMLHNYHPLIF